MKDLSNSTVDRNQCIASEADVKLVKDMIKSCILTRKGGMPTSDLREEYKSLTDDEIPIFQLGYSSLFHLLRDIPEIRSSRNEDGVPVLVVKENEKNKHLIDMISKQKDPKTYRQSKLQKRNRPEKNTKRKIIRQNMFDGRRNISIQKEKKPPVDEHVLRPTIYEYYHFEENLSSCTEPVVGKTQLIGDDYFLQLCFKYLNFDLIRKDAKSGITCGTVQSGQTIRKAIKKLSNLETMSNRLCINLGTVDIYNRQTEEEMVKDYEHLLKLLTGKYGYSPSQITLCTLPPMANLSMFAQPKQYCHYMSFNNWIRSYAETHDYNLLDLYRQFTEENQDIIDYAYFQQRPRWVSGTPHAHCLWNYFGRQKAMKLLLNL